MIKKILQRKTTCLEFLHCFYLKYVIFWFLSPSALFRLSRIPIWRMAPVVSWYIVGSDHLIFMGWGREDVFRPGHFFRDVILSFYSPLKAFTPVLDIFSDKIGSWIFFFQSISPTPLKSNGRSLMSQALQFKFAQWYTQVMTKNAKT